MAIIFVFKATTVVLKQLTTHISNLEILIRITVGQFFVIKPHQVQAGGRKVIDGDFVFDRFETEVIGCTVGFKPSFYDLLA